MIFLAASIVLQVACIVHAIKTGRAQFWIMIILFASVVGCLAYFIVEIAPTLGLNRQLRTAKAQVGGMLDPERRLRAARDSLALVDTPANRLEVADALAALGRHFDALPAYREALVKLGGRDPRTTEKLARTLFETGDAAGALAQLDQLPETGSIGERDRRQLLRARALEHLGARTRRRRSMPTSSRG